jgi:hypothetical protein
MTGTRKHARKRFSIGFTVALICLMVAAIIPGVMGADPVNLRSAGSFAVLGGQSVTNAGASKITGDLGVYPGTSVTGFPPGLVSGTIHAGDTVAAGAQSDALIAYNALWAQTPTYTYSDIVVYLDGVKLTPGVYKFPSAANLPVDGTLTLDFLGDPNAVFIFQMGSELKTMANSKVVAINTGTDSPDCGSNVYWAVGSSATIDGSQFLGTVIALTSITMTSAGNAPPITVVSGRMLALNGKVTMVDSIIDTTATCGETVPPTPTPTPTVPPAVPEFPTPAIPAVFVIGFILLILFIRIQRTR